MRNQKYQAVTDNLNRLLDRSLENFSQNTQWTDINNWLLSLETNLKENPSPYITEKIVLAKRLNQCLHPILPSKVHECVLRIHECLFNNMRNAVENNINDYIKLFAQDLGIYSVSILPFFAQTSVLQQRLTILRMIDHFYIDLGKELIPLLSGLFKSILPVYAETTSEVLINAIEKSLKKILEHAGRRYFVGITWSLILKDPPCRLGGLNFLAKVIDKMEFIKGEQDFSSSHGFSEEEEELKRQLLAQKITPVQESYKQDDEVHEEIPAPPRKRSDDIVGEREPITRRLGRRRSADNLKKHGSPLTVHHSEKKFVSIKELSSPLQADPEEEKGLLVIREVEHEDQSVANGRNDSGSSEVANPLPPTEQIPSLFKPAQLSPGIDNHSRLTPQSPNFQNQIVSFSDSISSFNNLLVDSHDIKLDKVPLIMTPGIKSIKEGIDDKTPENNFPNNSTLVVSSLVSCLEDDSQLVKRAALDFLFNHLRIKAEILRHEDRETLVQALLNLFKKKELSIVKRINRWLFGKEDEENRFLITEKNLFVVDLIVCALQNIFSEKPTSIETCTIPIKILQNLYIEHPHLIELTLSKIALHVLRYIFNYGTEDRQGGTEGLTQQSLASSEQTEEIIKCGRRFMENIPSHYQTILQSLGQTYLKGVETSDDLLCFEAVKYMDFCYISLMKHQHGIEELTYITDTLFSLALGLKMLAEREGAKVSLVHSYLKDSVLLAYNLIHRREGVQKHHRKHIEKINQNYLLTTGKDQIPPERAQYQAELIEIERKQSDTYITILENLEIFFARLGSIVRVKSNVQMYEDVFKLTSKAIVGIQLHLPRSRLTKLPRWFETLEYGIKVSNPFISLSSIEAIIYCFTREKDHPALESFKQLIQEQRSQKVGADYQKQALSKLWALLDYPNMHSKIIDLIVSFSHFFPNEFTLTVKSSFQTHQDRNKQASIQRFSHFWRLTGFKYKDLLLKNQQFVELNKVGLFTMLDFLDDPNPLVRHAAKNWLIESMPLLSRVVEPLIFELASCCGEWYETPKGLNLIKRRYDTQLIFSTFRRIRSMLSHGSYEFLRYVYQTEISDNLNDVRHNVTDINWPFLTGEEVAEAEPIEDFQREPVLSKELQMSLEPKKQQQRLHYFDMLVLLVVKYIQGTALESMGIDFSIGNSAVNASAVEFIQTLLDYVDHPELCLKIVRFLLNPLFKTLSQVVLNREYIMQIQLLNLFKIIFFSSSFRNKGNVDDVRSFFKEVFTNVGFIQSLLKGLNTPFAYIRSQFVLFITVCIPLIADFLEPEDCTNCIRHILFTYYQIIKSLSGKGMAAILTQDAANFDALADKKISQSRILTLERRVKTDEQYTRIFDNLSQSNRVNEMMTVMQGVSAVLNYFYDLNLLDSTEMKFEFTNPYTLIDALKSILTLGIASSQKDAKIVERRQFLHNLHTCEAILSDLSPVYETIVRSWPLSQEFVRIASEEFSSYGMLPFHFQRFGRYNRVVRDLITYVETEKQSIWGQIYSMIHPMFYKFPKDITQICLKLWVQNCEAPLSPHGEILSAPEKTQFLMKLLETMIVSSFPMNVLVHALIDSDFVRGLQLHYQQRAVSKRSNVLSYSHCCLQSKLLYFLYVYFNYVHIDQSALKSDNLLEIWSLILKVLHAFDRSKNPMTSIWILEILSLCSRKFTPKQLLGNEKFKHDLHQMINESLKLLAKVCSRKEIYFFSEPTYSFHAAGAEVSEPALFHVVLPLPPSLYQVYRHKLPQYQRIFGSPIEAGSNPELERRNRLYSFEALRKMGLQILQATYLPDKTQWVVVRTVEWVQLMLPTIEDKTIENFVHAECASQIICSLLEKARTLFLKPLRKMLLDIFNKDDFFICNSNTLSYWARIIDWLVTGGDTFSEYLSKVSLSSSYFSDQSTDNKRRIKSFERICFMLYSGCKDKYALKIKALLQKISDVIKNAQSTHPALLILILFSVRILILRVSELSLKQLFMDIWPMLLTFFMQIFSRNMVRVQIRNEVSRDPNLMLSALKLLEMISMTNLGLFALHQWVFIYDYFGVRLRVGELADEIQEKFNRRPDLKQILSNSDQPVVPFGNPPFIYRPYMSNYLPSHEISYVACPRPSTGLKPSKRHIIIKESFIADQKELKVQVVLLMQYLCQVAEFRTSVDWTEVEQVIVEDFIQMDKFIFNIKASE